MSEPAGPPPPEGASRQVTRLLAAMRSGDEAAAGDLFRVVHDELHRIAHAAMRGERPGHTLQTTALVNEACLKLLGGSTPGFEDRSHFLGIAARAMREVLVDHARRRGAKKRAGKRVALPEQPATLAADRLEIALAVHECLEKLQGIDPRATRVVELRFFAGLEIEEIAELIGVNERTVRRDWNFARAWLRTALA